MNIPRGVLGIGAMCAKEKTGRYVMDSVAVESKNGEASAIVTDGRALIALEWSDEAGPPVDFSAMILGDIAIQAEDFQDPKCGNLSVSVKSKKVILCCISSGAEVTSSMPFDPPAMPNWRDVLPTYEVINAIPVEAQKNQAVRIGFTAELLQKLLATLQTVMENVDTLGAENPDKLVMDVPLYPYRPIVFRKMGQNGVKLSAALMPADTDAAGK
jgi:hypothetical protein